MYNRREKLQLFNQLIQILLRDFRSDTVDRAFESENHLDINAAVSAFEFDKVVVHAVAIHNAADFVTGKAGDEAERKVFLVENIQYIGNIDSLAARNNAVEFCTIDAAGSKIRHRDNVVQTGVQCNSVNHRGRPPDQYNSNRETGRSCESEIHKLHKDKLIFLDSV